MINLAIIGAAGYTGQELLELIIDRNDINIVAITSDRLEGVALATVSERFATKKPLVFESNDHPRIAKLVDAVFLCLPHGISMDVAKIYLDNNCKILDLSADFRLKDKDIFEKWYLKKHSSYDLLAQSVYGLPELYKGKIGNADLIALPGCYPTASILSLAPIIQTGYIDLSSIVINAVSGVSGAGKKSSVEFSLGELYGEYFGYGDLIHRHTPEIEQELSLLAGEDIKVTFVPHLLPIKRGLYLTIYAEIKKSLPLESVYEMYRGYYREFEAVNIRKGFVKLSSTVMTPNIFIGLMIDDRTKRLVITTSIDNLLKGAASQAVECFDILYKRS